MPHADPPANPLALPEAEVYKHDRRSRVWRVVDEPGRAWVVKRFETAAWRQRLTAWVGRHPAQRERQWHERLVAEGLPVCPIVAHGVDKRGRHWLLTRDHHAALFHWLRDHDPAEDAALRHELTRQAGRLAGALLVRRLANRDHKASNHVVALPKTTGLDQPTLLLIDAGNVSSFRGTPLLGAALPMLLNLWQNAKEPAGRDGNPRKALSRTDRLRFFKAMLTAWPTMPDGMQHMLRHPEFD